MYPEGLCCSEVMSLKSDLLFRMLNGHIIKCLQLTLANPYKRY